MRDKFDHPYRVARYTLDEEEKPLGELAQCLNFPVAKGAWLAAMEEYPKDLITLQHGIRIMLRSNKHGQREAQK
jgi:hypothetical protein